MGTEDLTVCLADLLNLNLNRQAQDTRRPLCWQHRERCRSRRRLDFPQLDVEARGARAPGPRRGPPPGAPGTHWHRRLSLLRAGGSFVTNLGLTPPRPAQIELESSPCAQVVQAHAGRSGPAPSGCPTPEALASAAAPAGCWGGFIRAWPRPCRQRGSRVASVAATRCQRQCRGG